MPTIADEVLAAKRTKGYTYQQIADIASGLARKAGVERDEDLISTGQVISICGERKSIKLDDPHEPLPYVLRALGLGGDVVLRALGMGS